MKRINILVEGQTEETFVRDVLVTHYSPRGIYITPILAETSPGHKGGIVSYGKVENQLTKLCRQDKKSYVSTMIDFYGLPTCFPGVQALDYPAGGSALEQVCFLEEKLKSRISEPNFVPFMMLHEYEAVLFCEPEKFSDWIDGDAAKAIERLKAVASAFNSPEDINNSPQTAPSKRIAGIFPQYKKTLHGPLIAEDIGLDRIRQQCAHFDGWLKIIEQLPELG